jgi:imidazolonepropionase-like amidohydrolase
LGTDSLASVPDLDLWAEAAALGLTGDAALRALTLEAARALNWDDEIGALAVGKAGDCAVFPSAALQRPAPSSRTPLLTVLAGRVVHGLDS